ncbi:MAG: Maf family protein [Candidatus Babeliales bacterium]|nr:Maf family protein [Candidatus Babeliales bacterium]
MTKILYLASQSESRQRLLRDSGIPFQTIAQDADEKNFDHTLPLEELVKAIAVSKMEHVILPLGKTEGDICFVLSADTLGLNYNGEICTKPADKDDAIAMLKSYRKGSQTGTAFCLDKKVYKNNSWQVEKRILGFASAKYIFDVPDEWIERYFELSIKSGVHYLNVSGAVAIEEFGAQFLKTITGSYTGVVGLPLYEVRQALDELGFFS